MPYLRIRSPTSLRSAMQRTGENYGHYATTMPSPFVILEKGGHDSHPSIDRLILLVFEAVMEVVCVSLPGYIIARLGYFDAEKQKFLANLNVMLFTPCLIFTKLASQLNADKLLDLGVIPVIFIIQTLVSYAVATVVVRCFGLNKRGSNFVTAMGVFGNSNSLPISLVLSLSQTIKGLHWDKMAGDNDDEVAARGILYLLIFQQLGQLVRWSWGYHVLLAPKDKYDEYDDETMEAGRYRRGEARRGEACNEEEAEALIQGIDSLGEMGEERYPQAQPQPQPHHHRSLTQSSDSEGYEPAGRTPVAGTASGSPMDSEDEHEHEHEHEHQNGMHVPRKRYGTAYASPVAELSRGHLAPDGLDSSILSFPRIRNTDEPEAPPGIQGVTFKAKRLLARSRMRVTACLTDAGRRAYGATPRPLQMAVAGCWQACMRTYAFLWEFMNPPLWAMLCAVIVASVPWLQQLFFREESFIANSVTSAVRSSGGVAVPLILVVLGANLARNTQKRENTDAEEKVMGSRLLVASLISRMLLPTVIMAPILALFAKYVPVSILDDPIFVIVCFLLTGAPSALQLAQICQINNVYENVMSRILFQSYVVWILPSTLVLVMCALEVVEWAK